MMPDKLDELPPEYLYGKLKMLNIDIGEFMYRLLNDSPREIMIYAWVYTQYNNQNNVETKVEFVSCP